MWASGPKGESSSIKTSGPKGESSSIKTRSLKGNIPKGNVPRGNIRNGKHGDSDQEYEAECDYERILSGNAMAVKGLRYPRM
jgi:hypothetical protein